MPEIRGYIGTTLDGYVAEPDGGIGFLSDFDGHDFGYSDFIAQIETLVVGRRTFDQVAPEHGWPYEGRRTILLTHRPVADLPDGVEPWSGEVPALAARLREESKGDIWVVGGAEVQRAFLDAGELDRIQVHVLPRLLGDGVPLFPPSQRRHHLELVGAETLAAGTVMLDYRIRPAT